MSDSLDKFDDTLTKLTTAVKTVKSLRAKNNELTALIETTKSYADQVEQLELPSELKEERQLLSQLKQELHKVRESASETERKFQKFGNEIEEFGKFLAAKFKGKSIPAVVIKMFCEKMRKTYILANKLSGPFETFVSRLKSSQDLAASLAERTSILLDEAEEQAKAASSSKSWGLAGTVGMTALGAGLVALGFFTGGATWIAAGAAAGVGAAAVAGKTSLDVSAMQRKAQSIKECSDRLNLIANELEKNSMERAIQLKTETMEALQQVLEIFSMEIQKDNQIAAQQEQLKAKDEKIAELEERLARMRALGGGH